MTLRPALVWLAIAALGPTAASRSGVVRGSKHDISGPEDQDQVCAFCHTPHFANRVLGAPLWNRYVDQTKVYATYQSATMNTTPGNPAFTTSALCLGCHDGTIGYAVVNTYTGSDKHDLVNAPGPGGVPDMTSYPNCQRCHPDIYGLPAIDWTGTDLSNDHPIATTYPTAAQDPKFHTPPDLARGWPDVPLVGGKVECATCHDVHDPARVPFLRVDNTGSALCLRCHVK